MLCSILGDSIALGLALANPQCNYDARVGRSVAAISHLAPVMADRIVISAGSNHPTGLSYKQLRRWRKTLRGNVMWVAPQNKLGAYTINRVSAYFGDRVVHFVPGKDGVHPRSYQTLNRDIHKRGGL
jgi:hypothetical protein